MGRIFSGIGDKKLPLQKAGDQFFYLLCFFIIIIALLPAAFPFKAVSGQKNDPPYIFFCHSDFRSLNPEDLSSWMDSFTQDQPLKTIRIMEPLPGAILPPDMASPVFVWEDTAQSSTWRITIQNSGKIMLRALLNTQWWIPDADIWEAFKQSAGDTSFEIIIQGIGGWTGRDILSQGSSFLSFSRDRVDARLMFIRKPLPFLEAKNHPEKTSLLAGKLESYQSPEPLLSNPPVCANCHSYSLDGNFMTLDTDYKGDKGAFVFSSMDENIKIKDNLVFSWNTLAPEKPATYHMGLFAQVSPDGRFIAGTVNETAVFVIMDDPLFSQIFFPTTSKIGVFDTRTKQFGLLPGADFNDRVQTSPAWHPDGKTIAFSTVPANPELIRKVVSKEIFKESPKQTIHELNKKYPVQLDIYTLPFNDGNGGAPEPLKGAAKNGHSNFFPRYSPDGKWVVFTQSPTGMLLQPDSKLILIPSKGGEPRPLTSNQAVMNSWHSWSPNSKWIVFSSKANSPFTELYLTHIDEKGNSSPALRLFRFSSKDLAALIPEFVPRTSSPTTEISFESMEKAKEKSIAIDGR